MPRIWGMSWGAYIMNLLLLLSAYGTEYSPGSDAAEFDYNGNGTIDMQDFLHMLSLQPPIAKDTTIYCNHEKASR